MLIVCSAAWGLREVRPMVHHSRFAHNLKVSQQRYTSRIVLLCEILSFNRMVQPPYRPNSTRVKVYFVSTWLWDVLSNTCVRLLTQIARPPLMNQKEAYLRQVPKMSVVLRVCAVGHCEYEAHRTILTRVPGCREFTLAVVPVRYWSSKSSPEEVNSRQANDDGLIYSESESSSRSTAMPKVAIIAESFSAPSFFHSARRYLGGPTMLRLSFWGPTLLILLFRQTSAVNLDLDDPQTIKDAAATVAYGMVKYYHGNESGQTPGILPPPYYWWECGAMFNSLINYWYYTGDTTYNDIVEEGLLFQVGPRKDYMVPNQTSSEGRNQCILVCVMSAAELRFPDPPPDQPQWIALAGAVFETQAARWDTSSCGGGLHWQIFSGANGYGYKNTPANGGLFNLATRLGAYTQNATYFVWAEKLWNWMDDVGLISPTGQVFDGAETSDNCTSVNHDLWSYSAGIVLLGAATMWSQNNSALWRTRAEMVWQAAQQTYFDDMIMVEQMCESSGHCDLDQQSFKAYLSRYMAAAAKVAPWLYDEVKPYLSTSAQAAAKQCSGGTDGVTCGTIWSWPNETWDGTFGVGQQMCALEVIQANLIQKSVAPVTNDTGGTSHGGPSNAIDAHDKIYDSRITTADRAGAGIVTALLLIGTLGVAFWMIWE
nr:mannan endo-1,6-alpha-mannosidase dcw1 [Quercus suber]